MTTRLLAALVAGAAVLAVALVLVLSSGGSDNGHMMPSGAQMDGSAMPMHIMDDGDRMPGQEMSP